MADLISQSIQRRSSIAVKVGSVTIGGGAPIVVQSMTNTDTADVDRTADQIEALHRAGSELVRITVDREAAAQAVPYIKENNKASSVKILHYNKLYLHKRSNAGAILNLPFYD